MGDHPTAATLFGAIMRGLYRRERTEGSKGGREVGYSVAEIDRLIQSGAAAAKEKRRGN